MVECRSRLNVHRLPTLNLRYISLIFLITDFTLSAYPIHNVMQWIMMNPLNLCRSLCHYIELMVFINDLKGRGGEELSLELTRGLERSFLGGPNGSG